ncbi:hypothetical protein [Arthrobacter sp. FB24]|uniref:hypothetical protein n=1 Tax=Arthrobacter sp. (strain FB24) TaxID=290399 RepID=UPI0012EACC21|nr:hypothetical protein [Arthrobacter sp. FB24]
MFFHQRAQEQPNDTANPWLAADGRRPGTWLLRDGRSAAANHQRKPATTADRPR